MPNFDRGYRSQVFDVGGLAGIFASTEDPRNIDTSTFPLGSICLRTNGETWKRITGASDGWININPLTTEGDILYASTGGAPTRLAKGLAGQLLMMNSGATAPEWGVKPFDVIRSWFFR